MKVTKEEIISLLSGRLNPKSEQLLLEKIESCPKSKKHYEKVKQILSGVSASKDDVLSKMKSSSHLKYLQQTSQNPFDSNRSIGSRMALTLALGVAVIVGMIYIFPRFDKNKETSPKVLEEIEIIRDNQSGFKTYVPFKGEIHEDDRLKISIIPKYPYLFAFAWTKSHKLLKLDSFPLDRSVELDQQATRLELSNPVEGLTRLLYIVFIYSNEPLIVDTPYIEQTLQKTEMLNKRLIEKTLKGQRTQSVSLYQITEFTRVK